MTQQYFLLGLGVILFLSGIGGCSPMGKDQQVSGRTIQQIQEEHTNEWMAVPGVEGTAIGLFKGKPCIKILASVKPQMLRGRIPATVEGYPVIVEETGALRSLEQE